MRKRKIIPGVDPEAADQGRRQAAARSDAAPVPARRRQPRRADVPDRLRHHRRRYRRRRAAQDFRIQRQRAGAAVQPNKLAPTYPESEITRPFPFNAYYAEDEAPEVDGTTYKLEVGGLVDNKKPWTLDELYALPQVSQITRHVCVEGWSAIGSWQGVVLSEFLKRIGADTRAKYVWFRCAEGYSNTIDMATRAASADADDVQVRQPNPAAQIRLPDEDPHSDQARLQESEVRDGDGRASTTTTAAIGKTRATTGSADCSAPPPYVSGFCRAG